MLLNFANQLPKPVTNKEYTINNYFYLAKEVLEFDTWLFMADFDIKSSFTNISSTKTLNLCVNYLHINQTRFDSLTKVLFYKLLEITMFQSFFIFDGKLYEKCEDVAMGSPLGPMLANILMFPFKSIWIDNCSPHFKLIVYTRFFDDTFLLF